MKIAQIAPAWMSIPPKHYGGTETVIFNLVEEQVRQGHDVTLFAPADAKTSAKLVSFLPQSLIDSGAPWGAHMKAFYHLQKSIEYVSTHSFDVVHMHLSSASDMYMFPLLANARLRTPVLTTLHSRFPFDRVDTWIGDGDDYFAEWFLPVPMVAISERAKRDVPHPLNFVGVVHHGLPMETFKPTTLRPDDYFAWLGRFVPEKGPHLAIRAAKRAGVPLVLAGVVDKHLPASVSYFEEQIKPHIDGKQIRYIGPVGLEKKIELFSYARGMLNPIEWEEPFGMVMIEAMAVGCPVISFCRGASSEVVAQGKSGFLVSSVEEMAQAIPYLNTLARVGVRDYIVQNFSVRAMAQKYTALYEKVSTLTFMQKAAVQQAERIVLPSTDPLVTAISSMNSVRDTTKALPPLTNAKTDEVVQSLKTLSLQAREEME